MTARISHGEFEEFKDRLSSIARDGNEEQARDYIYDHFNHLPEETKEDIIFSSLFTAIENEADELEAAGAVLEEGLAAAEEIEKVKEELEKEPLTD